MPDSQTPDLTPPQINTDHTSENIPPSPTQPASTTQTPLPDLSHLPNRQPTSPLPKLLSLLGLLLVIVFLSVLYLSAYTNKSVPLVSSDLRKSLKLLAYKLPLLPKTPEQILLASSDTKAAFTSYNPEFSMSAKLGSTGLAMGSLDIKAQGPIDFSNPESPKFDLNLSGSVNVAGQSYEAKAKLRGLNQTLYFKIEDIPEKTIDSLFTSFLGINFSSSSNQLPLSSKEIHQNLQEVFKNWLAYDTSGLDSNARKLLDAQSQETSLIDTTRTKIQSFLSRGSIVPEVKLVGVEQVEGESTYHLKLNPSQNALREVITEFYPEKNRSDKYTQESIESLLKSTEALTIDAWFGTKDSLPRRLSISAIFNTGSDTLGMTMRNGVSDPTDLLSGLSSAKLSLSTDLVIRDIGKSVTIEVPSPTLTPIEYATAFSESMISEAEKESRKKKTELGNKFSEISQGLFKYYVENDVYPPTLSTVFSSKYSEFSYKLKSENKGYVVYVELDSGGFGDTSYYTPFYGITNRSTYPHQLTQYDFE